MDERFAKHFKKLEEFGLLPPHWFWEQDKVRELKRIVSDLVELCMPHKEEIPKIFENLERLSQQLNKIEVMIKEKPSAEAQKEKAGIVNYFIGQIKFFYPEKEYKVNIMSWNIKSGKNWKKIIDFIKKKNIDLIGFQEVDNNLERTNFVNVAKEIADALGFYYAYSPSMKINNGQFGNAIVSKFPIEQHKIHFLSSPEEYDGTTQKEPKTLLETKIKINNKIITFMTLHLGYSREFKTTRIKLKQIDNVVKEIKNKEKLILVGDFNSLPENKEINEIKKHLIDTDQNNELKTWTTYDFEYHGWKVPAGLNYKIDYVFVSKDIKFEPPIIDNNKISDHVPVIIAIEI